MDSNCDMDSGPRPPGRVSSVFALTLLTAAAMMGHLDRALFGFVMPQIKAEMLVSDTVLGLVAGLAFILLYLLLAIPFAWLADRTNRHLMIVAGLAFWSLMTFVTGLAQSILQIGAARVFVGAGEATNLGPSKSLVADLFEPRLRPMALSTIAAAPTLSGMLLVPVAGWIATHMGWRYAYYFAGAAGLGLAILLLLLVKEPAIDRGLRKTAPQQIAFGRGIAMLASSRVYLAMACAGACMTGFTYTASAWESTFLVRVHGFDIAEATWLLGLGRGMFGLLGLVAGGLLATKLGPTEARRMALALVAAFGLALTEAIFLLTGSRTVLVAVALISGIFYTIHVGVVYNVLTSIVAPRLRGMAIACFSVLGVLIGSALGPFLVGALSDLLTPQLGVNAIRYSLLISALFAAIGGVLFAVARRGVDQEAARIAGA